MPAPGSDQNRVLMMFRHLRGAQLISAVSPDGTLYGALYADDVAGQRAGPGPVEDSGQSDGDEMSESEPPATQEDDPVDDVEERNGSLIDMCLVFGFQIWALSSGGMIENVLNQSCVGRALMGTGCLAVQLDDGGDNCPADKLPWPNAQDAYDRREDADHLDERDREMAGIDRCGQIARAMRTVRAAHPEATRELMQALHDIYVHAARKPDDLPAARKPDDLPVHRPCTYGNRHEEIRSAFVKSFHGQEAPDNFTKNILKPAWLQMNRTRRYMSTPQQNALRAVYKGWQAMAQHKLRKGRKSGKYFALGRVIPAPIMEGVRAPSPFFVFRGRIMPDCLSGMNSGILKYEAPPPH